MAETQPQAMPRAGVFDMIQDRAWGRLLPVSLLRIPVLAVAVLLAVFLSYKAVHNQLTATSILGEDRVSLARFLDGTVHKPFAYRLLTPVLVHVAESKLGITAAALPAFLKAKAEVVCALATSNPPAPCDAVVAYAAVAMGFCFLFLMGIYWLGQRLYGHPLIALAGMFFVYLCVNATLLLGLSHTYDFSVMAFSTGMLLCLEYRRPLLFTALVAVAFMTKETLVLYAGAALFVNFGRLPLGRNIAYFIAQMALFVLIHGAIRIHFASNEGEGHEYYLPGQIYFFTEHIFINFLMPMILGVLLVFYDFPNKPETLRRASIIIAPWFVLYMIGGVPRELRVMFEIMPLVAMLVYDSCVRMVLARRPVSPR